MYWAAGTSVKKQFLAPAVAAVEAAGSLSGILMAGGCRGQCGGILAAALQPSEGTSTLRGMRAVVQRVSRAQVTVGEEVAGKIGRGLLVLLGVSGADREADADYLADKIAGLRIFEDAAGKMNLAVAEVQGAILVVSQFTLYGDVRRGKRPSFDAAAAPEPAERLYEYFVQRLRARGLPCQTGRFQAMMQVELVNDGPVTILLDSKKEF